MTGAYTERVGVDAQEAAAVVGGHGAAASTWPLGADLAALAGVLVEQHALVARVAR